VTTPTWPGDWLRGVLEVCVLRVLADGPTYGYAIATRLSEAGLGALKGGTLYPLLARFEAAGLVAVEWRAGDGGPGRKYYALTDDGRRVWRDQAVRWAAFAQLTTELVTSERGSALDLEAGRAADGGTVAAAGSAEGAAAGVPGDDAPARTIRSRTPPTTRPTPTRPATGPQPVRNGT
jgi:PadR family transcriptional regulator PadR